LTQILTTGDLGGAGQTQAMRGPSQKQNGENRTDDQDFEQSTQTQLLTIIFKHIYIHQPNNDMQQRSRTHEMVEWKCCF
jgi:hypothetical protein